jgi:integrase
MPRPRKLPEGMRVRNGEYHSDFYAGGRRVRKRLSGDFDVARQLLRELMARAERADFGLLDNDYPLADLQRQFLAHCRQALKPSSALRYRQRLANILGGLPAVRVSQVSIENVLAYRQDRLDLGRAPRTINAEVGALVTMLNWGIDPARLIGSNPIARLSPLPDDDAKEGRALTADEVARLLEASPPPWRDIWYAYLATGLRREELTRLTFGDIDRESRELIVRTGTAKNHASRRVPIDDELWEILERQRAGRAQRRPGTGASREIASRVQELFTKEHVFVSTQNTPLVKRAHLLILFLRHCRAADIPVEVRDGDGRVVEHVDIHSLRRTFATLAIMNGADPKSVQEILGHKTLTMTMAIYVKVHAQNKRQAIGKLPYSRGVSAPAHVLPMPERAERVS